ncbi:preprotein translocase subunit SecE [Carboxydochorda subterranea]|uniref:Protein translocase subunit SecE n=1 Tax=Carboxydichorda subterranea TaxID=3109565 RepID=A0ABZ1BYC8_9FIRM|nr:preprotein translocase subunit SecE [Limnochorda sp. L945t]WRP17706.1 preprotein translocase subunit SecE [Limnochorda sp. L945t]
MAISQQRTGRAERAKVRLGDRLRRFLREVRAEMRKVVWPTRHELVTYTLVVLVTVAVVAALMGLVDFVIGRALVTNLLGLRG